MKENIFNFIKVTNNVITKETSEQLKSTLISKLSTYNLAMLEKGQKNNVVSFWLPDHKVVKGSMEDHLMIQVVVGW